MSDDDLPFRCARCGAFVSQQRGYEADDFYPAPCKRCKAQTNQGENND